MTLLSISCPRTTCWYLLCALVLSTLSGCAERDRYDVLSEGTVVLAFGDSVTAGTGARAGQDYPSQLAQHSGLQVVNGGVPGDTARAAFARLQPLLERHQPALVIVELGGNDFLRQTPARSVKADLRRIIREIHAYGAVVALVAVPRLSLLRASLGSLKDSPIYAELAEEEEVILIPRIFSEVLSDADARADKIHPNAHGYQRLADAIHATLIGAGLVNH